MNNRSLILVADDDPDDHFFFQEAVAVAGPPDVEAHYVYDGAQLLRMLREKAHQDYRRRLVVLDLNMHVKNGRTTLKEIKADPALQGVPVVILTTSSDQGDVDYCMSMGAQGYFRKPSSIVQLVDILRGLCRDYLAA
jgi:two-component system response regulator